MANFPEKKPAVNSASDTTKIQAAFKKWQTDNQVVNKKEIIIEAQTDSESLSSVDAVDDLSENRSRRGNSHPLDRDYQDREESLNGLHHQFENAEDPTIDKSFDELLVHDEPVPQTWVYKADAEPLMANMSQFITHKVVKDITIAETVTALDAVIEQIKASASAEVVAELDIEFKVTAYATEAKFDITSHRLNSMIQSVQDLKYSKISQTDLNKITTEAEAAKQNFNKCFDMGSRIADQSKLNKVIDSTKEIEGKIAEKALDKNHVDKFNKIANLTSQVQKKIESMPVNVAALYQTHVDRMYIQFKKVKENYSKDKPFDQDNVAKITANLENVNARLNASMPILNALAKLKTSLASLFPAGDKKVDQKKKGKYLGILADLDKEMFRAHGDEKKMAQIAHKVAEFSTEIEEKLKANKSQSLEKTQPVVSRSSFFTRTTRAPETNDQEKSRRKTI